jgi:hypothetical protein
VGKFTTPAHFGSAFKASSPRSSPGSMATRNQNTKLIERCPRTRGVVHKNKRSGAQEQEEWCTRTRGVVHKNKRSGAQEQEEWCTRTRRVVHKNKKSGAQEQEEWCPRTRRVVSKNKMSAVQEYDAQCIRRRAASKAKTIFVDSGRGWLASR